MNKPARTGPRSRLEQREQDILSAASDLFASHGFHGTSTRRIAAQAGVSEGTVFHYFKSKNELLLAILDEFYRELTDSAQQVIADVMETRERLLRLAVNHVSALLANNALMIRLIQVYLSVDLSYYTDYRKTHIHELNYAYTRIFDGVIREGMQRGYLRSDLNLPAVRDLFFGGLEYGMRTYLSQQAPPALEDYVNDLIEPIWLSLQVDAAAPATQESRLEAACERLEALAERLDPDQTA